MQSPFEAHKNCAECDFEKCRYCAAGRLARDEVIEAGKVVTDKWGLPDFDEAPFYWGGPLT